MGVGATGGAPSVWRAGARLGGAGSAVGRAGERRWRPWGRLLTGRARAAIAAGE